MSNQAEIEWVRRRLSQTPAPAPGHADPQWTPLRSEFASRSYMEETHGGGKIEVVEAFDRRRAMTVGLPLAHSTSPPEMMPQAALGTSGLQQITDTTGVPWRSICQLIIKRQNGVTAYGTGWIAGPNLLVTAGHCVLDHDNGGWASAISVVPGSNGAFPPPFKTWEASNVDAHPAWVNGADTHFDYGFIILADGTVGHQLGWFGFSVLPDSQVNGLLVNIAGYPRDQNKPAGTMWFNAGRITDADQWFLDYLQETEAGESGAPVFWHGENNQRVVVAVHAYHSGFGNKGLRVTKDMYDHIGHLRGF